MLEVPGDPGLRPLVQPNTVLYGTVPYRTVPYRTVHVYAYNNGINSLRRMGLIIQSRIFQDSPGASGGSCNFGPVAFITFTSNIPQGLSKPSISRLSKTFFTLFRAPGTGPRRLQQDEGYSARLGSVVSALFGSVRFGSVRFGSVRFPRSHKYINH